MVDRAFVNSKLIELSERVERIRAKTPSSSSELEKDRDASELVAFNLVLALQCCMDIASHIIADEEWTPVKSLPDAFERLSSHGVISDQSRAAMADGARLRNLLVHGYGRADIGKMHQAATEGVREMDRFAREVASWIATRGST